jgi:hypothetical protein
MKAIHNAASAFFIAAVGVLSAISILGVWEIFGSDVIGKSFQTLGLLAIIAIVIIVAGRFFESKDVLGAVPEVPNPVFKVIRRITLGVLIVSASLLALLGVLAIWDVITDKEVLFKSLGSLAIIAFAAFIIVMTCLEREGGSFVTNHTKLSGWTVLGVVILAWILFGFIRSMMFGYYY